MTSHFSQHCFIQFYKPLLKKHKNGHEAANLAHLTKIQKICIGTTKPFFVLRYEHPMVKIKHIRESFNF